MACAKILAQSDYKFTNYSYLSETTVANFQNNGKIWILCVDKALLSDGKNTQIRHLSGKTPKNFTNSFWPIVKWSCER